MLYRKDCDLSIQKSSMFSLLEDISERYGYLMDNLESLWKSRQKFLGEISML